MLGKCPHCGEEIFVRNAYTENTSIVTRKAYEEEQDKIKKHQQEMEFIYRERDELRRKLWRFEGLWKSRLRRILVYEDYALVILPCIAVALFIYWLTMSYMHDYFVSFHLQSAVLMICFWLALSSILIILLVSFLLFHRLCKHLDNIYMSNLKQRFFKVYRIAEATQEIVWRKHRIHLL